MHLLLRSKGGDAVGDVSLSLLDGALGDTRQARHSHEYISAGGETRQGAFREDKGMRRRFGYVLHLGGASRSGETGKP